MKRSTFGIEFESNIIFPDNTVDNSIDNRHRPLNTGWHSQDDPTTAIEFNTPIYRSIVQAVNSISKQFKRWHRERNCAFYAYNANKYVSERLSSSGQHIHVGIDPNETYNRLYTETKDLFSKHLRMIYPLLMAISAQPIPSERMLNSSYCYPLFNNAECLPDRHGNHDQELNYSECDTIECRVFDTNIPQCSLAESWVLTKLLDHVRKDNCETHHSELRFSVEEYKRNRKLACLQGFASLPISPLLNSIYRMLAQENLDVFEVDSIREIYFLMAKYALNPSDIYHILKPKRFEYFKTMFENPDKYLANLLNLPQTVEYNRFIPILSKIYEESKTITNFKQLIQLSELKPTVEFNLKTKKEKPKPTIDYTDKIKRLFRNNNYGINRITELEDFSLDDIALKIEDMMAKDTGDFINRMTAQEIIGANERFYIMTVDIDDKKHILGMVALRIRNGEVMHLLVKENLRCLGIGKTLLRYIIDLSKETEFDKLIAFIRKDNTVSVKLFSQFGFKLDNSDREESKEEKRSNRYELLW